MTKKRPEGIEAYTSAAGGWGALRAVAKTLAHQQVMAQGTMTLLKANQPDGFDCPGCAWPDPKHTSSFEFCENGAKAITWESTSKRAGPEFFATNSVADLWVQSFLTKLTVARPVNANANAIWIFLLRPFCQT